ncbi:MAG: site-specific integrase, partial [Alphaproteobacteria bacterium]|nr:site-specific integrase [Alphaproteobacteria bacterium]
MRRLNGEGCYFYNTKTKLWRFCVHYKDVLGKPRQKSLYSRDKAELKLKVKKFTDKIRGDNIGDITVAEWADKWLSSVVANSCKRKTQENYATTVRNHIIPNFGQYKLDAVTASILQDYFNQLLLDRSPITVISIRTIFIVFFNAAIDFGYIKNNPAKQTRPPKRPKSNKKALSDAEITALVEIMRKKLENTSETEYFVRSSYSTAIHLALETGMREGEIFGLVWENVNLKKGIVFVKTTLSSIRGKARFDTPKSSHSER